MSIRREPWHKPPHASSSWTSLLAHPHTSPLVHVERGLSALSLKTEDTDAPKRNANSSGSDTEDDNDRFIVQAMNRAKQRRVRAEQQMRQDTTPGRAPSRPKQAADSSGSETEDDQDPIVQARRFGKQKQREAEQELRKKGNETRDELKRIVNKYYHKGKASITNEERRFFEDRRDTSLDEAVETSILAKYRNDSLDIMRRLPPGNEANLVPLKHWQMAKVGKTILETAARMCDAIVAEFKARNLDPVRDATAYTASMKLDVDFDFQSALPAAMRVPSSTIPSMTVQIHARTTPSKATAQLNLRNPATNPTSAITWSVLFQPGNGQLDNRIRDVVNMGLMQDAGRANSKTDEIQIGIETQNGLNTALNNLWSMLLFYPYDPYVHAWDFAVPAMKSVEFGPAPVRTAPQPRQPPQAPPGSLDQDGWRMKKRNMRAEQ